MEVTVTFYSLFRHLAGVDRLKMDIPEGSPVSALLEILQEKFNNPVFRDQPAAVLIHHQVVSAERVLREGDEVLLLPIMEGG